MRKLSVLFVIVASMGCTSKDDPPAQPAGDTRIAGDVASTGDSAAGDYGPVDCTLSFTPPAIDAAGAEQACGDFYGALCVRAFTQGCDDLSGYIVGTYGDVGSCQSGEATDCGDLDWSGSYVHPTNAPACLDLLANTACDGLDTLPYECMANYLPVPPAPDHCTQVEAGEHLGEVLDSSPDNHGVAPAKTFCLCLSAAQHVTIQTSVGPNAETTMGDTRLALVDATGDTVAYNDDFGGTTFSRVEYDAITGGGYLIVVSPYPDLYTGWEVGEFLFTITIN